MGLLLLQRKNWSSQVDDLKSAVADSQETLDREKAAHLLELSEAMKREEAAKKALDLERKCVNDVRFSDLLCFVVFSILASDGLVVWQFSGPSHC